MILQIILIISAVVLLFVLIRRLPQINKIDFKEVVKVPKINFQMPKMPKFSKKTSKNIKTDKSNKDKKFSFFADKENEQTLFNNAENFFKHGNFKEAERIYIKVASINPKNIKVYNRLGVIYMEKNEYNDAKESFNMAIKLDPTKAARYYNYALACAEVKEYRNAVDALEKALKRDRSNNKYKETLKNLKKKIKYRFKEAKRKAD